MLHQHSPGAVAKLAHPSQDVTALLGSSWFIPSTQLFLCLGFYLSYTTLPSSSFSVHKHCTEYPPVSSTETTKETFTAPHQ